MFDAVIRGLLIILAPQGLLYLAIGVGIGAVIAILPGLGGIAGMCIMLPFVWEMKPEAALPLLIGVIAVMRTADTIPSVLFSVPGTAGSAATILDGYPMAKQGRAAEALGAAFLASTIGAVISALCITASAPVARAVVSFLAAPEFFMLVMWGVAMTGTLTGKQPIKGILAALIGLLVSTVGCPVGAFQYRYTFDQPYLFSGVSLVILALGLFAIPEILDLLIAGTPISGTGKLGRGILDGFKGVFRNWFLILRCSFLGTFIGFLPGLGSVPASWFAYTHAVQTAKDKGNFGKGDIRGVVAPESANNAADGGALIPTIFFGIPGSGTMAIFMFALIVLGLQPGVSMVTTNYHYTFTIVWGLVIGAIMAALLSLAVTPGIARLTTVRIQILAPFIVVTVMLASFQETRQWADLIALLLVGFLGWIMKRAGWPRPPALVGFVLGAPAEKYLWISIERWGIAWLLRPGVIVIALVILATFIPFIFRRKQSPHPGEGGVKL